MSSVAINKEAFKTILAQFSDDVAFETELLNQLFNQLPQHYVDEIIKEQYFERLYNKCYFVIQHSIYKADRKVFGKIEEVAAYLDSLCLDDRKITMYSALNACEKGKPLVGYYITKKFGKNYSVKAMY